MGRASLAAGAGEHVAPPGRRAASPHRGRRRWPVRLRARLLQPRALPVRHALGPVGHRPRSARPAVTSSRNFFATNAAMRSFHEWCVTATGAQATLVEVDASLKEVGSTPLEEYFEQPSRRLAWNRRHSAGRIGRMVIHDRQGPSVPRRAAAGWALTRQRSRMVPPERQPLRRVAVSRRGSGTCTASRTPRPRAAGHSSGSPAAADGSVTIAPLPYGPALLFPHGGGCTPR